MILCCSCRLPTGGGRLSYYPDLLGRAHGRRNSNNNNDGTSPGENRWGEGGRGRTIKDSDVEDIGTKAAREGITLPLFSPIDVYIYRVGEKMMVAEAATAPAPPPLPNPEG